MATTAQDYPVTTKYGYVPGYTLNNGFHRGEDRVMKVGVPVVVNGLEIGKSGNTGASTGPHLHIGRWDSGGFKSPNGGGFNLPGAVVHSIGEDASNGKFIRLKHGTDTWIYCHLSEINVTQGQEVKEKKMYPTKPALQIAANQTGFGKNASGVLEPNFVAWWTTGTGNPDWGNPDVVLAKLLIEAYYAGRKEGQSMVQVPNATVLNKGIYEVK